jgi:hypothetical protein
MQALSGEGKSKKAAEHAAAGAALNHLRDVGLLKVPSPAARTTPPPQTLARYPPGNADYGWGAPTQNYGMGGGHPWSPPTTSMRVGGTSQPGPPQSRRQPEMRSLAMRMQGQGPSDVLEVLLLV